MLKVKPEVIVINDDDDSDDDHSECKPTNTKKKVLKKKRRKVERTINTSSQSETLVITQKVRKEKFKCFLKLTNICEYREKNKLKVKPSSINKNVKEIIKTDNIVPDCLRKRCKIDMKRKCDNYLSRRHKKELERKKPTKARGREKQPFDQKKFNYSCEKRENKSNMPSKNKIRVEPVQRRRHSNTRYLSPISSDWSDVLSENIMSYEDISSDSTITTEIDTLIKRTKDRERKSSANRSYDYEYNPLPLKPSPCYNNISSAKITKKNLELNDSQGLKKVQQDVYKRRNKLCAVKPVAHIPPCDCIPDIASIPLPETDKPNHLNENIIDIDNTYEPAFMSTPKFEDNIEILDASATDDGTLLTGEMDIVSFHSQGTLVLDTFYSPSHPNDSPILMYDAYSPAMSPAFLYHEPVTEKTPSHCVPSPLMSPPLTHLLPNSVTNTESLNGDKPHSPDSPIIPIKMSLDDKKLTDPNVKQEQSLKSKEIKVEHTSKISIKSTTNVNSVNIDIKKKVKIPQIRESLNNERNSNSYINIKIKEEVNEDSVNNNIKLSTIDNFGNVSLELGIKREK